MKNKIFPHIVIALSMLLLCGIAPLRVFAVKTMIPPDTIKYPGLEFHLKQAEKVVLENGMVLFYLPDHELPLVSISALVRTGSMNDPVGKEGTAELTAYVMRTGGTRQLRSTDIDQRLDFLASSPSISMSLDSASIKFSFLKNDLDDCLDLLSQMLIQPAFEQEKLQLALSLQNEQLRRIVDDPQKLAFREFNRLLYPDDPRGRYMTSSSLKQITRDDLIAFHKEYFYPSNMMLAVSGDISKEEAVNKIRQYFGKWKNPRQAMDIAPPPRQPGTGVFFIRKQLPQSTVVSGEFTVNKNDPDYYAFFVLDFIIGSGGFPSRIFNAVRNNEGLAYSAGSFYRARTNYGIFGTYALTKTSSTIQAHDLIKSILHDVASGSVSQAELDWAKKSILNSFIFSFEQPDQVVSQQMSVDYEKLPADYLRGYRKRIEAVTRDDLKRVAAKYLNEKRRLTLIVGDTDQFGKLPDQWEQPVFITPQQ
ncbi:MAG: M16 family metallopeptidase [Smithellaceae bacterium]